MEITLFAIVVTAMIFCGCTEENNFYKYTSNVNGEIEVIDERLTVTHVTRFTEVPMTFVHEISDFCKDFEINKRDKDE